MLVDPVKHYFYIWLIHVRLSHVYGCSLTLLVEMNSCQQNGRCSCTPAPAETLIMYFV